MSEQRIWLEEAPIDASPLRKDGLTVWTTELSSGQIETFEDVQSIVDMGDDKSIIVIPRSQIAQEYLERVESSFQTTYPFFSSIPKAALYTYWHPTNNHSTRNALPHVHDDDNIHAALNPSKQPTVFFSRSALKAAIGYLSKADAIEENLRGKLQYIFSCVELESILGENAVLAALVAEFHNERSIGTTECVRAIQQETRSRGGLLEIPLTADAYGMVGIPRNSVHSRGVLDDFVRDDARTAWRYFRRNTTVS